MDSKNITIIIKDTNNNLVKNAQVSISPGNINGRTDETGQVKLILPDQKKITVTVNLNGQIQQVPYYITSEQNNRLEINLAYLKHLKNQELQKTSPASTSSYQIKPSLFLGIIITAIILILVIIAFKKKLF